jgi:molecular chaperone DnaK
MNRTTIDFGIDLGTTNSAIAVLKGVSPEIIKNSRENNNDITPSAVHINRKGEPNVGFRAKQRIIDWPDDTFIEFKRRMGSDFAYHFESSGQTRKPEDLSAEVLKVLKGEAQVTTGEMIEAAVITVPAAFELHQCDATRKAAQLAGFKQSALLTEPVAAALAFGFQADSQKAYWLVYDFGGGTFDAALVKAEDGTIHIVNNGGDNFLGGMNIDWALVEKLIAPRLIKEFGLENFDRSQAGTGGRWRKAFAQLKFAAEQAKIDLSQKERVSLDPDYASNLQDEATGKVVVDELDMEVTRADLIRVAEPFIRRSIEITKRVLKEGKLSKGDVQKVILVGGPTHAPYFREILADSLGIPLDYSCNPFTVVAHGAAVFAGTQRLEVGRAVAVPAGEFSVEVKSPPIGVDSTPTVGGRISGGGVKDFTGCTIELVNEKTQRRSDKISLSADGVFTASVHAARGEKNTYVIELFDSSGLRRKVTPDRLTYTIGASPDEQTLINSIGVALANDGYAMFFKKGSSLSQHKNWKNPFHTVKLLKQGQSGELINIPVVEGENERASRNRRVGELKILADNIRRDLPAGSEVDVTLKINEKRICLKAFVPLLDEEFEEEFDLRKTDPQPEQLSKDCDAELNRFGELKAKASGTGGETAKGAITDAVKSLVAAIKELEVAAKGDADAALEREKRLLELKEKLDEVENTLEWPTLVAEAKQWLADLDDALERCRIITDDQEGKAAQLKDEIAEIISQKKVDRLRKKREQVESLYWDIVFAQGEVWVNYFNQQEKEKARISDHARRDRLLNQGRLCIQNNNINGLRSVVTQLWDLLPKPPTKDEMRRGYLSDVI